MAFKEVRCFPPIGKDLFHRGTELAPLICRIVLFTISTNGAGIFFAVVKRPERKAVVADHLFAASVAKL